MLEELIDADRGRKVIYREQGDDQVDEGVITLLRMSPTSVQFRSEDATLMPPIPAGEWEAER